MNILKFVWRTFVQLVKHACSLPQTIANVINQRRHNVVLNERETERLDRIRNPSKYRGK